MVGTSTDRQGQGHGFLLHDGRVTIIDVPGAPLNAASERNRHGHIVGFSYRPVS